MNVKFLKSMFRGDGEVRFLLPDGKYVPHHAHITEVAKVTKTFIDCGGTKRDVDYITIQVWCGDDMDHRLTASRARKIFDKIDQNFDSLNVKVEVDGVTIGLYDIYEVMLPLPRPELKNENEPITLQLSRTYTNCLAPDKCKC